MTTTDSANSNAAKATRQIFQNILLRPFVTTILQDNKGENMNDITRQTLFILFFIILAMWKFTEIIFFIIIKFYCWNIGAASTFFFCIFIFCIRYRAYQRKIEAQK